MSPRGQSQMSFGIPPLTRGVKWLGIVTLAWALVRLAQCLDKRDPAARPAAEEAVALFRQLGGTVDIGAFEMCRLAKLPILVFNYKQDGAIEKAIAGQPIGTVVSG